MRIIYHYLVFFSAGITVGWLLFHTAPTSEHKSSDSPPHILPATTLKNLDEAERKSPASHFDSDPMETADKLSRAEAELNESRARLQSLGTSYMKLVKRFQRSLKEIAPLWTPAETAEYVGSLQREYFAFCSRFPEAPPVGSPEYAEFDQLKSEFREASNALVEAGDIPKMLGMDQPKTFSSTKAAIAQASLGLSASQTQQVESAYSRYYQEAQQYGLAWEKTSPPNKSAWEAQRKAMDVRFREELRGYLSPAQQQSFDTNFKHDGLWLTTFGDLAYQL
jgi:hypothetical protein